MSIQSQIERITNEVDTQSDLIEQIKSALDRKTIGKQEKTVEITENGTTEVTPDAGYLLSGVTVITNIPIKEEQEQSIVITNEDDRVILPEENFVLSKVNISVDLGYDDKLSDIEALVGGEII